MWPHSGLRKPDAPVSFGGVAQSSIMEAVPNIPSTAHILGGAAISANVGVTPSLTITALAEHALSHVQPGAVTSRAKVSNTSR